MASRRGVAPAAVWGQQPARVGCGQAAHPLTSIPGKESQGAIGGSCTHRRCGQRWCRRRLQANRWEAVPEQKAGGQAPWAGEVACCARLCGVQPRRMPTAAGITHTAAAGPGWQGSPRSAQQRRRSACSGRGARHCGKCAGRGWQGAGAERSPPAPSASASMEAAGHLEPAAQRPTAPWAGNQCTVPPRARLAGGGISDVGVGRGSLGCQGLLGGSHLSHLNGRKHHCEGAMAWARRGQCSGRGRQREVARARLPPVPLYWCACRQQRRAPAAPAVRMGLPFPALGPLAIVIESVAGGGGGERLHELGCDSCSLQVSLRARVVRYLLEGGPSRQALPTPAGGPLLPALVAAALEPPVTRAEHAPTHQDGGRVRARQRRGLGRRKSVLSHKRVLRRRSCRRFHRRGGGKGRGGGRGEAGQGLHSLRRSPAARKGSGKSRKGKERGAGGTHRDLGVGERAQPTSCSARACTLSRCPAPL